jgi:probable poly-beta-1,6-N-acetyl-D-glucosamine export protein
MHATERFTAIANLRVVAIVAIMLNHAQIGISADTEYSLVYLAYSQFFKFGSLLFMIISGFLFEKSVYNYSHAEIFKRKALTILVPSIIFMIPWAFLNIMILPHLGTDRQLVDSAFVLDELHKLCFKSIYWFPINLFLMLAINNFIRNKKLLKWLLVPAALITLFYSVNIYFHWVPRRHNSAIFAYFSFFFTGRLLYLYLGSLKQIFERIKHNVAVISTAGFVLVSLFVASVLESMQIQESELHTDPGNILRLSNVLYTFVLLALIFNFRNKIKTGGYFQEKSVFLIYLIHPYLLFVGKHAWSFLRVNTEFHTARIIPYEMGYAILLLLVSLFIARKLQGNKRFNAIISGKLR